MANKKNHKKTAQKAASVLMSATVVGSMAFPLVSTLPVFATENDVKVVSTDDKTSDTTKDTKKSKSQKKAKKQETVESETETTTELSAEETSDDASDSLASLLAEDTKTIVLDAETEGCPFVVSVLQNGVKGDVAVKPGEEVTYDVTIRNAGDKDIDKMVMYMALPDGMDYVDSEVTQDNSEGQHSTWDRATVSWAKGERLLTIRPSSPTGKDTTPTIKAGETLSFALKGKVTAEAGTELSTKLRIHYHGENDEVVHVESEAVKATVAEAQKFVVNFDANEGKSVSAITAEEGQTIIELPETTREGYQFDGWYTAKDGGDRVTKIDALTGDMTLYAHWTATTYTVDFDTQGGDKVDSITANIGEKVTELPTPERKGYVFAGWFDAAEGGNQVTELTSDTKTLYAHWTAKETEKKVETLELKNHELTVKSGDDLDLKYIYGPSDAANAEFVWTSSDENIIAVSVKDGKTVFTYKGTGVVKLTVSTKDGSVSDTCTVTVEAADKTDGKDDGKDDTNKDNNGSTTDDNGSGSGDTTTDDGSGDTKNDADAGSENAEVKQLTLNIIMPDGSTKTATVKDSVKLDDLVQKLGYTSVKSYKYRTASNNALTSLDGTVTIRDIVAKAADEEILVIGYDESGKAVGCAKVAKSNDTTYTVTLSKDTNVALNKNDESEKGKGEGEVSHEGKSDAEAPAVHTADNNVLPVYGAAGGLTTALLGVMTFLRKKFVR